MTLSVKDEKVQISLRPVNEDDLEFLFRVYASTRQEEMRLTGWEEREIETFLRMQFQLQHTQYMRGYQNPTFDIIVAGGEPAGRFYVDRNKEEYRLIDIALLPEFRGRGIGGALLDALVGEAEEAGGPVTLHVEKNNPVLGHYRQIGFRIEADRGAYYFMVREPTEKGRG